MNELRSKAASGALPAILFAVFLAPGCAFGQDFSAYPGSELYTRFCASCHGTRGEGDGPVANSLRVLVPDLTRLAIRQGGKFPEDAIRRIIDGRTVKPPHGPRYMPVWGYEFRAADPRQESSNRKAELIIDKLVEYLESIQAGATPADGPH
jgi:mono/diheme cytochrome c family protein